MVSLVVGIFLVDFELILIVLLFSEPVLVRIKIRFASLWAYQELSLRPRGQ